MKSSILCKWTLSSLQSSLEMSSRTWTKFVQDSKISSVSGSIMPSTEKKGKFGEKPIFRSLLASIDMSIIKIPSVMLKSLKQTSWTWL